MKSFMFVPSVAFLFGCGLLGGFAVRGLAEPHGVDAFDKAQAEFESNPQTGRGYNWPWFHLEKAGMRIRCTASQNATLRLCALSLPLVDPKTLEPSGIARDVFVCSTTECAWTDDAPYVGTP